MNQSSDMWLAFVRTFSMLFIVLALLILAFYLIKKISRARRSQGKKDDIRILSVHHLSPKEKLVLLDVLGDTLLIGVTPSHISKISTLSRKSTQRISPESSSNTNEKPEPESDSPAQSPSQSLFSQFLVRKLGSKKNKQEAGILKKVLSQ